MQTLGGENLQQSEGYCSLTRRNRCVAVRTFVRQQLAVASLNDISERFDHEEIYHVQHIPATPEL